MCIRDRAMESPHARARRVECTLSVVGGHLAFWAVQVAAHMEEGRQKKLAQVALDTLADVDFGQHLLLGFTQDVLLSYACSEDEVVRKSAARAAWAVTERQWAVLRCAPAAQLGTVRWKRS